MIGNFSFFNVINGWCGFDLISSSGLLNVFGFLQCERHGKKAEFIKLFRKFVECVLQTESRDAPVERCIQFIAK